jgi:hypothetical protein
MGDTVYFTSDLSEASVATLIQYESIQTFDNYNITLSSVVHVYKTSETGEYLVRSMLP